MGNDKKETSAIVSFLRDFIPWLSALVILIAYAWFLNYLLTKTQVNENEWMKLVYLFGSLEAIVFTAVGFIFGREVNRSRAINAEKDAEKAKKEKGELVLEAMDLASEAEKHAVPAEKIQGIRTMTRKFIAD